MEKIYKAILQNDNTIEGNEVYSFAVIKISGEGDLKEVFVTGSAILPGYSPDTLQFSSVAQKPLTAHLAEESAEESLKNALFGDSERRIPFGDILIYCKKLEEVDL